MGTVSDILEAIAKLPLPDQQELLKRAETNAAIQEAEEGDLPSFDSIDDLMDDLHA